MRPGQLRPGNPELSPEEFGRLVGFNEAGAAFAPGNTGDRNTKFRNSARFNEAGAASPRKPIDSSFESCASVRFNEAGAASPRKLVEDLRVVLTVAGLASMRPGQLRPGNACSAQVGGDVEAGASMRPGAASPRKQEGLEGRARVPSELQ